MAGYQKVALSFNFEYAFFADFRTSSLNAWSYPDACILAMKNDKCSFLVSSLRSSLQFNIIVRHCCVKTVLFVPIDIADCLCTNCFDETLFEN